MIVDKNTKYTANQTITVRTTAGEEMVARFVEEDANSITVTKPMAVMVSQQGVGLGTFVFSAGPEGNFKLNKSAILFTVATDKDIAKQYIQTTTGITV